MIVIYFGFCNILLSLIFCKKSETSNWQSWTFLTLKSLLYISLFFILPIFLYLPVNSFSQYVKNAFGIWILKESGKYHWTLKCRSQFWNSDDKDLKIKFHHIALHYQFKNPYWAQLIWINRNEKKTKKCLIKY